jgi:Rap1a immunity proteins
MSRIVMLICALLVAASVLAQDNGNDLLSKCRKGITKGSVDASMTADERWDAMYCMGYIGGVVDADKVWQLQPSKTLEQPDVPHYCFPKDTQMGQIHRVVLKYLEDNPQKLYLGAAALIRLALHDAFPCQ